MVNARMTANNIGANSIRDGGESLQNRQNEEEPLDVNYRLSREKDQVNLIWSIKPVEPRPNLFSKPVTVHIPMRLVLVMDISHSMEEPYGPDSTISKLDKIKMFAQLLVRSFHEDDSLGVVGFGTRAKEVFKLQKMSQENKDLACKAIEDMQVGGVTNLSGGILAGLDQFKNPFSKSRFSNDNIILFTDGMANEGIVEADRLIKEVQENIETIKEDCHYEGDYTVKLVTIGTGGFLPELIFDVGRAFSSDAFYFLDETSVMELNLMKPILLRHTAMVTHLFIRITALNGSTFDRDEMCNEFRYDRNVYSDEEVTLDKTTADFFLHDLSMDMEKTLICRLKLPNKRGKKLKQKDMLKLEIQYRDATLSVRTFEKVIPYSELPSKKIKVPAQDIILLAQHETRIFTSKVLDDAASCMQKLHRAKAKTVIQNGICHLRSVADELMAISQCSEEDLELFMQYLEPYFANLEHIENYLVLYSVRWDDAWGRLKAMSSCLVRESPTCKGIFLEGTDMYFTLRIEEKLDQMCERLRDLYILRGLCTEMLDRYSHLIQELKARLAVAEEEPEEEEGQNTNSNALSSIRETPL